jgi:predicted nucleotidyltransferase
MIKNSNKISRTDEVLSKTVDILVKNLDPKSIILFGSRAKKIFSKTADFDLAIDTPKPKIRTERKILEAISEVSGLYKFDIIYFDNIDNDFKKIVLKTGKQIYDKRRN